MEHIDALFYESRMIDILFETHLFSWAFLECFNIPSWLDVKVYGDQDWNNTGETIHFNKECHGDDVFSYPCPSRVETALAELPAGEAEEVPKRNVTKSERAALYRLRKYSTLVVLKSDGGNASVIMDKPDYHHS